jgi:hypothetical protein
LAGERAYARAIGLAFATASARYRAAAEASLELVSAGGLVNGVVQWIALTLDEATHYENCPGPAKNPPGSRCSTHLRAASKQFSAKKSGSSVRTIATS